MLKSILNLEGAQQLSKNEQKNANGGRPTDPRCVGKICPQGYICIKGDCWGI